MDLQEIFNNEYVLAMLVLFVLLYSGLSRPELPKWVSDLFKNDIFRVIFIALIAMIPAKQAPHVAIIIAVVFVMTLHFVFQEETRENLTITENFVSTSNYAKSKENNTN
jgi:hypothetical protein